jgi:hypothetical protein
MRIFCPVPSRHLGNGPGINNIPHKEYLYFSVYSLDINLNKDEMVNLQISNRV